MKLAVQNTLAPDIWCSVYHFISKPDLHNLESGCYELCSGAYATVSEYFTKSSAHFECHRKYIDIQILMKGSEYIDIGGLGDRLMASKYDEEKDIEFFDMDDFRRILLNSLNLVVIFPGEAHRPCLSTDSQELVKKLVIKIPFIQ